MIKLAAGLTTLMVIEPSLNPCFLAVILAVPNLIAVTKPVAPTEATSGLSDSHVTPSCEAVNCTVSVANSSVLPPAAVTSIFSKSMLILMEPSL